MTTGPRTEEGLLTDGLAYLGARVITGIPDAVIYADRHGIIRFWNAGATRIFGFSEREAVGQSLDIIIPERLRERHWQGFYQMMETGRSRYPPDQLLSVPALTSTGKTISIEFTVAPIWNGSAGPEGIAAILRDVTQRFQELKQLRKAAEAQSRKGASI